MTWYLKLWMWLKKYWKYVLFPIGIIVGILSVLGRRKSGPVIAPEVLGAEEDKKRAREDADKKLKVADAEQTRKIQAITEEHAKVIDQLNAEQKGRLEELREDPDELNNFRLSVGKDVRDDSR